MKTSNNYISVDTAKTLINKGAHFSQNFLFGQSEKNEYKIFLIVETTGKTHRLNKKNAILIKEWLKTQNK
jgi:hypothetical protein